MKKVLWLCNVAFSENKIKETGSWLQPLATKLQESNHVEIYNITLGHVKTVARSDYLSIKQWIIPYRRAKKFGQVASRNTCMEVAGIISEIKPDLVHIWGTESIWASVYQQGFIDTKTVLDIQGLLFSITKYFLGSLTIKEVLKSIHMKELILPWRNLYSKKRVFEKKGEIEQSLLKSFKHISTQSEWVKQELQNINPNAQYYKTKIMLRQEFYEARKWKHENKRTPPIIFSSTSAAVPYKGLHVLIKALSLVKKRHPDIQLHLAGNINVGEKLLDGYSVFLKKLAKKHGVSENITILGPLDAEGIVNHLQKSSVCVVSSFVESYCLAFAEAMVIGVPTVVSFTGATPELAEHGKEALFYNPIDHVTCAAYIDQIITDNELALKLSQKSQKSRVVRNDAKSIIDSQLSIYNTIIQN